MTSIEWLIDQLIPEDQHEGIMDIIEDAKERHKQEIMNTYIIADSESTQEDSEHYALKFYERTYGSKGSDEHKYYEQSRGINVNSFQSEAPKKEEYIVKVTDVTSSQTEISDEEIEKGAKEWYNKEGAYSASAIALKTWVYAIRWYREQLKTRQ
jgi:hypothetical protein